MPITTGGNVNDVSKALDLVDGILGRPGRRPDALRADKGYDSGPLRHELARRRIVPVISHRGTKGVNGLGKLRYLVAQTLSPAPPVQTPRRSVGTPPRPPRRSGLPGLRPHLPTTPPEPETKTVLLTRNWTTGLPAAPVASLTGDEGTWKADSPTVLEDTRGLVVSAIEKGLHPDDAAHVFDCGRLRSMVG